MSGEFDSTPGAKPKSRVKRFWLRAFVGLPGFGVSRVQGFRVSGEESSGQEEEEEEEEDCLGRRRRRRRTV